MPIRTPNHRLITRRGIIQAGLATAGLHTLVNPRRVHAAASADFSFALLPDTQLMASFTTCGNNLANADQSAWLFTRVFQWISDNKTSLNIKGIVSLGDVVDQVNISGGTAQEPVADYAYDITRNAGIPDQSCCGNHDLTGAASNDSGLRSPGKHWLTSGKFSLSTMSSLYGSGISLSSGDGQSDVATWGGSYWNDALSTYTIWHIGNIRLLWASTRFFPSDAELDALEDLCASYPDHTVLINTHGYLRQVDASNAATLGAAQFMQYSSNYAPGYYSLGPENTCWNSGETMRDRFHAMPNVVMAACGHDVSSQSTGTNYNRTRNNVGRDVAHIVSNYQGLDGNPGPSPAGCGTTISGGAPNGTTACGHVTLLKFRPSAGVVECYVYSVNKGQYCKGGGVYQSSPYVLFSLPFAFVQYGRVFPVPGAVNGR